MIMWGGIVITHSRYEARPVLLTNATDMWGVFDTFTQRFVEGENSVRENWVNQRAAALSHAYARAL